MTFDLTTETIAHFIGVFSIQLERARAREEYEEYIYSQPQTDGPQHFTFFQIRVDTSFTLNDVHPEVQYEHAWPELHPLALEYLAPGLIPVSDEPYWLPYFNEYYPPIQYPGPPVFSYTGEWELQLQPPGSFAVVIGQYNSLIDQDIFLFDGTPIDVISSTQFAFTLRQLEAASGQVAPIDVALPPASSEEAMAASIEAVAASLQALNESYEASPDGQVTDHGVMFMGPDAMGFHVNGQHVLELPEFDNLVIRKESTYERVDASDGSGKATVETGGNTLVNQAVLVDAWTGAPVMAVMENWISINIVMQANVWRDMDCGVSSASDASQAFNIAALTFSGNPLALPEPEEGADPVFPENWTITRLETNLVSYNWLEQTNRVVDGDIVSVGNSGYELYLQTGGNTSYNLTRLDEFGLQYDLIIIAKSVLHANIIEQYNIMLDDDFAYGDWSTADGDALLSSGNTLWNAATIQTIGETTFLSLPDHYFEAAQAIGEGGSKLSQEILNDPFFEGLSSLNVLYIDGNLIDLNYLKQTNILEDADQIALLESVYGKLNGIETGDNLLLNSATIYDVSVDTVAYVGGQIYTDALLHQADLVDFSAPDYSTDTQLTSEAVVFLADGMIGDEDAPEDQAIVPTSSTEAQTPDLMQSMTG